MPVFAVVVKATAIDNAVMIAAHLYMVEPESIAKVVPGARLDAVYISVNHLLGEMETPLGNGTAGIVRD